MVSTPWADQASRHTRTRFYLAWCVLNYARHLPTRILGATRLRSSTKLQPCVARTCVPDHVRRVPYAIRWTCRSTDAGRAGSLFMASVGHLWAISVENGSGKPTARGIIIRVVGSSSPSSAMCASCRASFVPHSGGARGSRNRPRPTWAPDRSVLASAGRRRPPAPCDESPTLRRLTPTRLRPRISEGSCFRSRAPASPAKTGGGASYFPSGW
jgi:hypothetical protein